MDRWGKISILTIVLGIVLVFSSQAIATYNPLGMYEESTGVSLANDANPNAPSFILKHKDSKPIVGEYVLADRFGTPSNLYSRAYVKFLFENVPQSIDVENATVSIPINSGVTIVNHPLDLELKSTRGWVYENLSWDKQPKFLEPIDTGTIPEGYGDVIILKGKVPNTYVESMASENYVSFVVKNIDEDVSSYDDSSTAFLELGKAHMSFTYTTVEDGVPTDNEGGENLEPPQETTDEGSETMNYVSYLGIILIIVGISIYIYNRIENR